MLATVVFAAFLSLSPAPGNGLGLAPGPVHPQSDRPLPITIPTVPLGIAFGVGGVAALAVARPRPRGRNARSEEPVYVLVPGHGATADGFDDLVTRMGIDPAHTEVFDYRWAYPTADPELAAQRALTADAADALNVLVSLLAREHANIYLIAHSKGGAVVTELVSRWDADPLLAVPAVSGAALLDPAIATGALGDMQRLGFVVDDVADNGLFDPVRCGWLTCTDVRANLGAKAGVEVIAIRNPDAIVTNFTDDPDGMRIYDLDDRGPHPLARPWDVAAILARIREAHGSVLHSDVVAACITAEATLPGSCVWPDAVTERPRGSGRSGGGPLME